MKRNTEEIRSNEADVSPSRLILRDAQDSRLSDCIDFLFGILSHTATFRN